MILSIIMEYYQLLSEKYNLPVELYLYIWGFINNDELLSLKIKKDDPVWNGRIPNIRSYFVTIIKNEICQKNGHCMEYFLRMMDKSYDGDYRISDEHLWTILIEYKEHNIISDCWLSKETWLSKEIGKYYLYNHLND